jgi:hypothetical protein
MGINQLISQTQDIRNNAIDTFSWMHPRCEADVRLEVLRYIKDKPFILIERKIYTTINKLHKFLVVHSTCVSIMFSDVYFLLFSDVSTTTGWCCTGSCSLA